MNTNHDELAKDVETDSEIADETVADTAATDTAAADTEVADIEAADATVTAETDDADATTDTEATDTEGTVAEGTVAAESRRNLGVLITVVSLAVLLAASAAVTIWLYFTSYRPDQKVDAAAQQAALEAAKSGTVAALTYSPEELDKDLETAKSQMTGDFLSYYTKFTDEVVRKAVADKQVSTTAQVVRAAVSEMGPETAKVLVFVNQATTSNDRPDPSMAASSVLVTLSKVDGKWLISAFDPV
ncbi:hypothetical protein MCNF_12250 [Mycolicibacterium confluentis]|uniref:Twin-arginine translocation pathway signal n=1 Tax=Mycolicibacterium confluentis TaxID=28047 RepID=A0A7I7XTM5_9MYCO|nr:hypothetical protein [Mycolicibacterium confluentis]BBZ32620.1 hypothetical protein MCNF_12250 [Mycolicibacterium confluentis]